MLDGCIKCFFNLENHELVKFAFDLRQAHAEDRAIQGNLSVSDDVFFREVLDAYHRGHG